MQKKQDKLIVDSHLHLFPRAWEIIKFNAGRLSVPPEILEMLEKAFEICPDYAAQGLENIVEAIRNKTGNVNAFAERFFKTRELQLDQYFRDAGEWQPVPIMLNLFSAGLDGLTMPYGLQCFSCIPGDVVPPPEGQQWAGAKAYTKFSGEPSDRILKYCNDNGLTIAVHVSKGGIWGSKFKNEREANAAAHPLVLLPVMDRFPEIKWLLCHGGGNDMWTQWGLYLAGERRAPVNNWAEEAIWLAQDRPGQVFVGTGYHEGATVDQREYRIASRAIANEIPQGIVLETDWPLVLLSVGGLESHIDDLQEAYGDHWSAVSWSNPLSLWKIQLGDINWALKRRAQAQGVI